MRGFVIESKFKSSTGHGGVNLNISEFSSVWNVSKLSGYIVCL